MKYSNKDITIDKYNIVHYKGVSLHISCDTLELMEKRLGYTTMEVIEVAYQELLPYIRNNKINKILGDSE